MYWVANDFEEDTLRELIESVATYSLYNKSIINLTSIYAVFKDDTERPRDDLLNAIQYRIDSRFEVLEREMEEEKKAQQQLEKEYWEGRL